MDLYNQDDLEDWPAGPAEDHLGSLLDLGISAAERCEANEIVELFLTLGAEFHSARAKSGRTVFSASSHNPHR